MNTLKPKVKQQEHLYTTMFSLKQVNVEGRIHKLNLDFEAGQQWHVLGPNGAGKSSLLRVLAGLLIPDSGDVLFNGVNLDVHALPSLAQQRCFLQQQEVSAFDISLRQLLLFYTHQDTLPERLEACLQLADLLDKPLCALSGGQQQRFNIARCLMQVWPCLQKGQGALLLDEPCQHLDINYQFRFMHLLTELSQQGNLVITSSHDINMSLAHADKVVMLKDNQVLFSGDCVDVLSIKNLAHIFEHEFLEIPIATDILAADVVNQHGVDTPQKYITSAANQAPFG